MLNHPVIVFKKGHIYKIYYTFDKNGVWCGNPFQDIRIHFPKKLGHIINDLMEYSYEEGEGDGQFETDELHSENNDFAQGRNPMA